MNIKKTLAVTVATASILTAWGVPAKRGLHTVTLPDGTSFSYTIVGDEFNHYYMTSDSLLITPAGDNFNYATLDAQGRFVDTGVRACDPGERNWTQPAGTQFMDRANLRHATQLRAQASAAATTQGPRRAIAESGKGLFSTNFPHKGKIKSLVILVQYQDVKFNLSDPQAYFSNMLNKDGFNEWSGTGSAHDFFMSNSNGQFDPQFDVFGPYTLSGKMSYYGGNDAYGDDQRPEQMVVESCRGLDSQINFADYDMDNDGYVDNVFIFYAGRGEASGGTKDSVWPHAYYLRGTNSVITLDGKKIDSYGCSNEWEGTRPDGVGTFVHEFSHIMGLPDLYATDYSESVTPGSYSAMDYGPYNNNGCTPPNYSMYERNALQWTEPTVLKPGMQVSMGNLADTNEGYIIQTGNSNEFFLIENRQLTGWDKYIPAGGMIAWHIDYNATIFNQNKVNNTAEHTRVRIIPANNQGAAPRGWTYPGSTNNTELSATSSPALKTWADNKTDVEIKKIAQANGIITFTVPTHLSAPADNTLQSTEITSTGFTASWKAVTGATDYLLTVMESASGIAESDTHAGTLPSGWTQTTGGTYTTGGNYGQASPSMKFSATGNHITTRTFSSPIHTLNFWVKGQTITGTDTKLTVSGFNGSTWTTIWSETPENSAKTIDLSSAVAGKGYVQVKFEFTKSKGNTAIDDIVVAAGGASVPLQGYVDASTSGATSVKVTIPTGANSPLREASFNAPAAQYSWYVKATDGEVISEPTSTVTLTLADPAGIEEIGTDDTLSPAVYYNLQGIVVDHPTPGHLYIRRQGNRATKVIF